MILFNLSCANDHEFEAWFKDGATYDKQVKKRQVSCPVCGDSKIAKAPMAPRIGSGKKADAAAAETAKLAEMHETLSKLRNEVEKNCDYVGPNFAEEARKIHYKETDPRNIYGETSKEEAKALKDEGVEFSSIPWVPRNDS
jgi:hypothetical protein